MKTKNKTIFSLFLFLFSLIVFVAACQPGQMPETQDQTQETKETGDLPNIQLQLIAQGLNSPVYLTPAPDNSNRLFVVDRAGTIRVIENNQLLETPFLDLKNKMVSLRNSFDERGLLGLAFHPDFQNNQRFFVYYSAPLRQGAPEGYDHTATVSEFTVSENHNIADSGSEKIILQVDEPQFNHDGGQILFGPDNFLYIALGDGGNADDIGLGHPEMGNGQDISTLLGSILRIDIDNGEPYSIPPDNPFVGTPGQDEIFAYGFRNPFRMSFDAETGRLFVGDVGQNQWEEVDIVAIGRNYGWNIKEGTHCFDPQNPDEMIEDCADIGPNSQPLIDPILEYGNLDVPGGIGLSVIGGYVYRGQAIPEFAGKYIFGDWSSSSSSGQGFLLIAEENNNQWSMSRLMNLDHYLLGFGQDRNNELYVLTTDQTGPTGTTGKVYRMIKG